MKSDLKIFKTGINKSKNLSDIRRDDKKNQIARSWLSCINIIKIKEISDPYLIIMHYTLYQITTLCSI